MDHVSTWFQSALLPEKWEVAGVSCASLSVWHYFALEQTGNPYLHGTRINRDHAAALLMYCCGDYQHGRRLFTGPFYRQRFMRRIARKLKRRDWPDIDAAIIDYLQTCLRCPAHKSRVPKAGETAKTVKAPAAWVLVDYLSGGAPSRIDAAWDTPYAVARCLFDAHRDIKGDDDSLESIEDEIYNDRYIERERKG